MGRSPQLAQVNLFFLFRRDGKTITDFCIYIPLENAAGGSFGWRGGCDGRMHPPTIFCPSSTDRRIVFLARSHIQQPLAQVCSVGGECGQGGAVVCNFFKKSEPFPRASCTSVVSRNVVVKFLWLSLRCHQRFGLEGWGGAALLSLKKAHSPGWEGR
uniref:Uncharacterized protein n=1 Tax=Sphaerodactylus townsendi TaxID=933632 RepID=A0ACB8F2K1_9SAUR